MKICIINGPNLNLLTKRSEENYGSISLEELNQKIRNEFPEVNFHFFQSNIEGEIIEQIQKCSKEYDGLIINPGGYSHTSVAIRDALEICTIPKIEVHLSNVAARESFRHNMITASVCNGYIAGLKEFSYIGGIFTLFRIIKTKNCNK